MVRTATFAQETFVNSLAVTPHQRGRGLGSAILERTVERLIEYGAKHVLLEVETRNDPALSIYQRCGFRTISTYRYYGLAAAGPHDGLKASLPGG